MLRAVEERIAQEQQLYPKTEAETLSLSTIRWCLDEYERGDGFLYLIVNNRLTRFERETSEFYFFDGGWHIDYNGEVSKRLVENVIEAYAKLAADIDERIRASEKSGDTRNSASLKVERADVSKRIKKLKTIRGVKTCLDYAVICDLG
jgi:hypothetical protein